MSRRRGRSATSHSTSSEVDLWPEESFAGAAGEIVKFFGDDGFELAGTDLADIGCGADGVMDLGVFQQGHPSTLVGFDLNPVDRSMLLTRAAARGVATRLPDGLQFRVCDVDRLPADDNSFDHVFSWSAFEHITRPLPVLREIHRILRPGGMLMIQLWPFFHSKHGAHLWDWYPEGFSHLLHDPFEVERQILAQPEKSTCPIEVMVEAVRELNRITIDDLQRALLHAHFGIVKLQLLTEPFHIPVELAHLPLSLLAVAGVKLLAAPQ